MDQPGRIPRYRARRDRGIRGYFRYRTRIRARVHLLALPSRL